MDTAKEAFIWITTILKKHQIPFQISGGLAARAYGATRPLEDIDIDIPDDKFSVVKKEVDDFITFGPERFVTEKWDLLLMTLNYHGQDIDLSGANTTKIFNDQTGEWQLLSEDFSKVVIKEIFGVETSVMPKEALIAYKKILGRAADLIDISALD